MIKSKPRCFAAFAASVLLFQMVEKLHITLDVVLRHKKCSLLAGVQQSLLYDGHVIGLG